MSVQLHEFRIPFAGVKRTVIYHFSDLHLAVADETSTPDEVTATQKAVSEFDECRRWFAEQYHEPFAVEKTAVDYFEEILAACGDGDAVLCAGDLAECYHPATMQYLDAATAGLNFMTVCGNHDTADKIPEGYAL